MFLCDKCFNDDEEGKLFLSRSHGSCEGCGQTTTCCDVPKMWLNNTEGVKIKQAKKLKKPNKIKHIIYNYHNNEIRIKLKTVPRKGIPVKKLIKLLDKFDKNNNIRPPIGLKPKFIHYQERQIAIIDAINRYLEAGKSPPKEWVLEFASYCD